MELLPKRNPGHLISITHSNQLSPVRVSCYGQQPTFISNQHDLQAWTTMWVGTFCFQLHTWLDKWQCPTKTIYRERLQTNQVKSWRGTIGVIKHAQCDLLCVMLVIAKGREREKLAIEKWQFGIPYCCTHSPWFSDETWQQTNKQFHLSLLVLQTEIRICNTQSPREFCHWLH